MFARNMPLTPDNTPDIAHAHASTRKTGTPIRPLITVVGKRTHRQAKPATVEKDDHAEGHRNTQAKGDCARRGDAHPDHLKADGVGRQPQAARPIRPK